MLASVTALMLTAAPAPAAAQAMCGGAENPCHHAETAAETQKTSDEALLMRGAKLSGLKKIELAALLKSPAQFDGKTIALEGTVRKACERKGCWMELAKSTTEKGPGVRVTFKDYGFFVPLDSAGRTAKVEGVVKVADLSEDTAKHYEAEGAQVPRSADGKPREVQLVALGVELRR